MSEGQNGPCSWFGGDVEASSSGRSAEIAQEQTAVDARYTRLDELRQRARSRLASVRKTGPSGTPQNRSERDSFATLWEDRVAQLEAVEDRLAFGRLDLDSDADQLRYIGRIGLLDERHRPILTDWRAPAAEPFYRATALNPQGVVRRRHLVTTGRKVTGFEDELLDLSAPIEGSLEGEGALLAALAQRRTGRMTDIVATIQAEQDEIIRADMTGALVVQGGPGTGKTAVALHRAAYLLYRHRKALEKSGVLLVGPSRAFLRFIDQVLPSLGETGVVSTTIGELLPGITATGSESDEIAEIKGRAVWSQIISRAVRARERVPAEDVRFRLNGRELVITRRDVKDAISRTRRIGKPHNEARAIFVRDMLGRLVSQYQKAIGRELDAEDRAIVREDLREIKAVRVALNLAWFPLSPKRLIDDLYTKPHRLAAVAPELTARERTLLRRDKFAPWTVADIPLLDEAAELLGMDQTIALAEEQRRAAEHEEALKYAREALEAGAGAGSMIPVNAATLASRFADSGPVSTTAQRAAADRGWTYGHVIVDEAQELSAMSWRMLLRRVPTRSMTIVGDVAQTSSAAGVRNWAKALDPVLRGTWRIRELTVSYRTPAEVAEAASAFARAAGLPMSKLTAAREVPGSVVTRRVADGELVDEAIASAVEQARRFISSDGFGQVAVIARPEMVLPIAETLDASLESAFGEAEAARLRNSREPQLSVLTPESAKGLEFDAVILVEPAAIAGWHDGRFEKSASLAASDLLVAMTRPTQQLVIVHSQDLPPGL
ncbi:MAG: PhoH family protein [Promicromonosporaceae bacterium]|nr:PhoH family protein [Promicromonosporaceae bacterium]